MTNRHLTRQELLEVAQGKPGYDLTHLDNCEQCRIELGLLSHYRMAGRIALPEPPTAWVNKAISLASSQPSLAERVGRVIAELTFDSWSLPAPAGVRGTAPLTQRRLRLEASPIILEIRAEKKAHQWSFVAQAAGTSPAECRLEVGGNRMQPDGDGFFQWSSKTPPRSLILTAGNLVLEAPELSWKMPKP